MVRSASHLLVVGLGLGALTGCATTQQQAARVQINSARIRESQTPLRFSGRSSQVEVEAVRLIPGRRSGRSTVVVTLRNRVGQPVSDLPLLVSVSLRDGHRISLNRQAGDYFQNHVPAIGPHALLNWVLPVDRRLPAGARPFAQVGPAAAVAAAAASKLPVLRATATAPKKDWAGLTLTNLSGVPQFQLPVYVVARRQGRSVAAGQAQVSELDGGQTVHLNVSLIGNPAGATLSLQVPPTILR